MRHIAEAFKYWLVVILSIIILSPIIIPTFFVIGVVAKVCWYVLKFGFNLF